MRERHFKTTSVFGLALPQTNHADNWIDWPGVTKFITQKSASAELNYPDAHMRVYKKENTVIRVGASEHIAMSAYKHPIISTFGHITNKTKSFA